MKKLIYLIAILFLLPVLYSCENFLDTQNFTQKNSQSFPKTVTDANQMLTGVYAVMNLIMDNDYNKSYFMTAELASDDRMGGGGANDKQWQCMNHLLYTARDTYKDNWAHHYLGVSRATASIAALQGMDEGDLKNQKLGEAKVLRAYFYFELVQLFGDIPLMKAAPETVSQAMESPPQAPQDSIFVQIGTDLWEAYSTMPSYKWNDSHVPSGTITKWAAAGMLARVWLFYTGFYGKSTLPIDGGEVTAAQVAAALKDCIDNSGCSLTPDYRSLWTYTNSVTKPDYPYAKDAPTWLLDGTNPEIIFALKHIGLNGWNGNQLRFTNQFALAFGLRAVGTDYTAIFPMGQGWGAGPVNSKLWDEWLADEPNDPRRKASIYNQADESTGYNWGADSQVEETGLWQKKIVAITAFGGTQTGGLFWCFMSSPAYEGYTGDNFQTGNAADIFLIRYADILLMHSEITKTADGMNQVRARAGLPAVAYSDDALRKERRHELAFEGLRWGDIRRWHIAEQVLGDMYNEPIRNAGVQTTMKPQGSAGDVVARYKATNGFFMIPQNEIDLAGGALKQNAGWETNAVFTSLAN